MVKITAIRQFNERFAKENDAHLVCVFAGATSGSGAGALEAMVGMLHTSTFYIIGRSAAEFASQRKRLEKLSPGCKLEFLEAQVSLLSDVDGVCKQIATAEKKVDLLYMSPGCIPFGGPWYTKEGLETCFAISYYSRMRLIQNLLPLLRQSPRPRVLTLLNGGKEKPIFDDDIGLEKRWSAEAVISHTTTMTSLALEHLAQDDERIAFLHVSPGLVNSGNFIRVTAAESAGVIWRAMLTVLCRMITAVQLIFGITPKECGERQAYHLTSDQFGPGAWRVGNSSEVVSAHTGGVFEKYKDGGWSEKIWEHTTAIFESAFATRIDREVI
ncbi:hypothetical protein V502_00804 [Pseudogymnoascus sp. VKM F-4520 (FW-2644)]|nr:hypothetical protein V502_00804 [Pseudogymnoascus sp. VKM F-4520 (FW-2644)]